MTEYRPASASPVPHVATKYDGFKLVKTETPYKHQKGSGRSACFEVAKDGQTIGEWTKACAQLGFDSRFVVGSLIKLSGTKQPGWTFSKTNDKNQTLADIKKIRDADPKALEARAAKKAAAERDKAAKKEAAEKAKADKAQKDAEAKAKKAAEAAARKAENDAKAAKVAATKHPAADAKAPGAAKGKGQQQKAA